MIKPKEIHGKRIAMIAWGEKEDGSDDVAVFTGIADWDNGHFQMLRDDNEKFRIEDEWIERIKEVTPDLKETLLGADYCFSVTIGTIKDSSELKRTGLKWPINR